MRTPYFTSSTIGPLSRAWLEEFGRPGKMAAQPFQIQRAGLLVLDMQCYFLNRDSHACVPSGEAILPRLNRLIGAFRAAGRPVVATRHVNDRQNGANMGTWWSELITEDHPLVGLDPGLEVKPGEILDKSQYDAFYRSHLEDRLNEHGVRQLVIGGVMTHLCCETTAREAFVRGYQVFFLVDGTATYTEAFHRASLRNLAHGFAVCTSVDRLLGKE